MRAGPQRRIVSAPSEARVSGVGVDTMVISWLFDDRPNPLADTHRELIDGEPVVLAFQAVVELRFSALRAGWGELRRRRLERRIAVRIDNDDGAACHANRLPSGRTPTFFAIAGAGSPSADVRSRQKAHPLAAEPSFRRVLFRTTIAS